MTDGLHAAPPLLSVRDIAFKPKLSHLRRMHLGVDVLAQSQIIDLLNGLRSSRRLSLLFICHDLAIVPRIAGAQPGPTAFIISGTSRRISRRGKWARCGI